MILESMTIDQAAKIGIPLANKLYKKISPYLSQNLTKYFDKKVAEANFEKDTVKYFSNLIGSCSVINTIAFQNSPKKLEELYLPLTLKELNGEKLFIIDNQSPVIHEHDHILIVDSAGMGKSTLAKKIILNCCNNENFFPVYIELRQLDETSIYEQIQNKITKIENFDLKNYKKIKMAYVFDGLDEIPENIKSKVFANLKKFAIENKNNKIIITSRNESFLSEFFTFKHFYIKKLSHEEAFELLKKYDPSKMTVNKLIESIKKEKNSELNDFLTTPLFISLLFCSYRHKTVLPTKKDIFYGQVYDALFEAHDLSKEAGYIREKASKLDSADFHKVLRRFAFWCLGSNGKIEFDKATIEIVISEILINIPNVYTTPENFVKDLFTSVPIFVKEGTLIRWSHKSLMEYFAAMFICHDAKTNQKDIILALYNSKNAVSNFNILSLCYHIDYNLFRITILKCILEKYILYYNEKINFFKTVQKNLKEARISFLYLSSCSLIIEKHINSNERTVSNLEDSHFKGFSLVSSELNKKNESKQGSLRGITSPRNNKLITIGYLDSFQVGFLKIIQEKNKNLFLENTNKSNSIQNIFNFLANLEKPNSIFNTINSFDYDGRTLTNSTKNFELFNQIIPFDFPLLSIEAAKSELAAICDDDSCGIRSLIKQFEQT